MQYTYAIKKSKISNESINNKLKKDICLHQVILVSNPITPFILLLLNLMLKFNGSFC